MGLDADAMLREWAASFDADWADAARRMQALWDRFAGARTAVIEDNWGVLELGLDGRAWVPFAGNANWPDGEVATAPVETGVNGRIRFPGALSFGGGDHLGPGTRLRRRRHRRGAGRGGSRLRVGTAGHG
jgi:aminopeptidase